MRLRSGAPIARRLVLVAFVLVAIAAPTSSQASTRFNFYWVTAKYSGVLDESFVYNPSRPDVWQSSLHFTFSESETDRINGNGTIVRGKLAISAGGQVKATYAPPNTAKSCTGTFSLRPKVPDPFTIGTDSAGATMPISADYVKSSSKVAECSAVGVSGAPFETKEAVEFGRAVVASCDLSRSPCKFAIDSKSSTNSASFRGTLTVTRSSTKPKASAPPTSQPVTAARRQAKNNAVQAVGSSLTSAMYPCLLAVEGLPTSVNVAGAVMVTQSRKLCDEWAKTLYDEVKTVRDPPRSDYDLVAHVSPASAGASSSACSRFNGAELGLCKRLEAKAGAYARAVGRVASVSQAVRTTVERDTAAAKAGKSSAVAKQERALKQLLGKLAAAQKARRSSGAAFAATLRAAKVTIKLSKSEAARALAAVTAKVESLGLEKAILSSVAGSRLAPRPIDAIAALGA